MKNLFNSIKYVSKTAILVLIIILPCMVSSQPADTSLIDYLKQTNGFKEVILGSDISLLHWYNLTYLDGDNNFDADSCLNYVYTADHITELGNGLRLDLVAIRAYKNKIVNIYLFFKTDDGHEVLKDFIANYGPFTTRTGAFMYDWNTKAVDLSLKSNRDLDLGVAIYTCNDIETKLNEMRLKKRETFERQGATLGAL